jgi:hypothetical protein
VLPCRSSKYAAYTQSQSEKGSARACEREKGGRRAYDEQCRRGIGQCQQRLADKLLRMGDLVLGNHGDGEVAVQCALRVLRHAVAGENLLIFDQRTV